MEATAHESDCSPQASASAAESGRRSTTALRRVWLMAWTLSMTACGTEAAPWSPTFELSPDGGPFALQWQTIPPAGRSARPQPDVGRSSDRAGAFAGRGSEAGPGRDSSDKGDSAAGSSASEAALAAEGGEDAGAAVAPAFDTDAGTATDPPAP
jgi:hypothetical protein